MSYYIYLDESGKETKREERGRGKTKSGFTRRDDGNFYSDSVKIPMNIPTPVKVTPVKITKVEDSPKLESPTTPLEGSQASSVVTEVLEEAKPRLRHYKPTKKITLDLFLKAIHVCAGDRINDEKNNTITLTRAYVQGGFASECYLIEGIAYPGTYAKIFIDLNKKEVSVWGMIDTGDPIAIIDNPFKD